MKKASLITLIFLTISLVFILPIFAQENSDSEDLKEATTSDVIRQKVQQKLEEAKNKPKARLGTITDISETTIQIKSLSGEIQQISVNEESTAFVKLTPKRAVVKYSDVAIGDFIVAMGYLNGEGVLDSKRILITNAPEEDKRKVFLGTVLSIERKKVSLKVGGQNSEGVTINFPARWKGPEISDFSEGDTLIVIVDVEEDKNTVRTIEIIKEGQPPESPTPTESEE